MGWAALSRAEGVNCRALIGTEQFECGESSGSVLPIGGYYTIHTYIMSPGWSGGARACLLPIFIPHTNTGTGVSFVLLFITRRIFSPTTREARHTPVNTLARNDDDELRNMGIFNNNNIPQLS